MLYVKLPECCTSIVSCSIVVNYVVVERALKISLNINLNYFSGILVLLVTTLKCAVHFVFTYLQLFFAPVI